MNKPSGRKARFIAGLLLATACSPLGSRALPSLPYSGIFNFRQANDRAVTNLIDELYPTMIDGAPRGPDQNVRDNVKRQLLTIAHASRKGRRSVIRGLIAAMRDQRLRHSVSVFPAWHFAATLLGQLKAKEAINVLIDHLDYESPLNPESLSNNPAIKALVDIGEPTVTRLGKTLLSDPRRGARCGALVTLHNIGGNKVIRILEQAMQSETDSYLKREIEKALSRLKRETD